MKEIQEINQIFTYLRKLYYRNKIWLGLIRFSFFLSALFLLFVFLQYVYFFESTVRSVVFFSFILLSFLAFILIIVLPVFRWFGLFMQVPVKEINSILRKRFPEIEDRFLNMMELLDDYKSNKSNNELILASIKQRIIYVKRFTLKEAFNFRLSNIDKWSSSIAVGFIVFIGIFAPGFLYDGYFQYSHYKQQFSPSPEFLFVLLNDSLSVKKGARFKIVAQVKGKGAPDQLSIVIGGNQFPMESNSPRSFSYTIGNVYNDLHFQLKGDNYFSDVYHLRCLPVPVIRSFQVEIVPPDYTGLPTSILKNQGDAEVPQGSHVSWKINTIDTDTLMIADGFAYQNMSSNGKGAFHYEWLATSGMEYFFRVCNSYFREDGLVYNFRILKDEFPAIAVVQVQDSVHLTSFYFRGRVSDDYGIRSVKFHITGSDVDTAYTVSIHPNQNPQEFFYGYDFSGMKPGIYQYWFSVSDNDLFHHFKQKQTSFFTFRFPGYEEIAQQNKDGYSKLQENLNEGKTISENIQNEFEKMRTQMLSGELTDWEKKKISDGIKGQNNQLEELMKNVGNENRRLNNISKNFSQLSPALLQKQQQVEQLMDQLYSDELKKLFDEFSTLLKDFDQKKFDELTQNIRYRLDDLDKQLDRNLAILKKLQVEKSVQDLRNNLLQLAKKQEQFSQLNSHSFRFPKDSLRNFVNEQNRNVRDAFSSIDSVMKSNSELEAPYSLDKSGQLQKDVLCDFEELSNENDKIGKSKQKALSERISRSLQNIAENLNNSLVSSQMEIDWAQIRRLQYLSESILKFSFHQEKLMNDMAGISPLDPSLNIYLDEQRQLIQYEEQLRDSLFLLSKQSPQISSQIGKESMNWKYYTDKAMTNLEESQYTQGRVNQQFSMTSANNLALYLSETLQQVRDMLKNSQPGDGNCNKPGGNNSTVPSLAALQKRLKAQMEGIMNDLKNGVTPGNNQIGRMLMQQEIIQQAIRGQILRGNIGLDVEKQLKEAQRLLERNRQDLLTKDITQQTVNRQNLIFEHLLDAQNAKIQRNSDDQRESESAKNQLISHPKDYFEQNRKLVNELDIISNSSWRMNYFYREKFNSYLKNINGQKFNQPTTQN